MADILQHISIEQGLLIIFNLIIIESLLSVDNAAVLATMVMDLPKDQRKKALKYGILGAYVFRGLALVLASYLVTIWWLKPLGGIYLIYLAGDYFYKKSGSKSMDNSIVKESHKIYLYFKNKVGIFWSTVFLVEAMDIVFSIDNVLAAAAYVEKIEKPTQTYLLWIGVFIGILAMRFVAQGFVRVMEKFPFLENCAFIVILILGIKLLLSMVTHFIPETGFGKFIDSHLAEYILSFLTTGVFVIPIITSLLFNFPKKYPDYKYQGGLKEYDDYQKE